MKNDKKWLRESINELKTIFNGRKMGEYEKGRLDGYSHVSMLIDYLDEPEKPVIPKFVADYIELNKGWSEDRQEYIEDDNSGLWFALDGNSYGMPNSVSDWLFNEEKVETFAKAWLDGFTIANEDKQEVEENFYTFDNAKKWLHDNGFVVFEKDKLDEEVQRMVDETYEATNEKTVIPQFVADWIEEERVKIIDWHTEIPERFFLILGHKLHYTTLASTNIGDWVFGGNEEKLYQALKCGYEVEKEPRWVIEKGGNYIKTYLIDSNKVVNIDYEPEKEGSLTFLSREEAEAVASLVIGEVKEVTE